VTLDQSLEIEALTSGDRFPTAAVQYAVLTPDGTLTINGDQSWVRDGRALEHYKGGTILCRNITIGYGPWRDVEVAEAEDMADDYRDRILLILRDAAEIGRHARTQVARLRDPGRCNEDALTALEEIATRLVEMGQESTP
jgi:hypothetical protein